MITRRERINERSSIDGLIFGLQYIKETLSVVVLLNILDLYAYYLVQFEKSEIYNHKVFKQIDEQGG